ncbi:antibiotic biosynthesis monooxygenase [Burkholderia sp. AU31624]|uniref:putative quinol monooxygenase n=1 Tax=Burkholderia TaxID=32008 RepID=UPI000B7AEE2F|nr:MULTISPECIES: putative quinol monooxygenase [Burkholderia]MCA8060758.1 antibiotic biosynthesis monooxygenase [Burkholderia sp. AU38729]MCA8252611.1 antibiotic biosynthesis monooxygenase [Burkholderia sp. AU31624]OXI16960.1 antibiotic biosynthesis monooxygenase [Burkholderia sp. AU15512]RQT25742.1 antibiotic biosynthesis monooxygenase [Burkholderia contaminans]VWD34867.1 antibiotic biosynthesis monooxygenase [Burkholderia contaminans]
MSEIVVTAINVAKPGKEAALEALLRGLLAPTEGDPGMIRYELSRDLRDPRTFVFHEIWESQEALDAHLNTRHIAAYRALSPELVERKELLITRKVQ